MWETLRIAALAGSVLFWGGQAMRQVEKNQGTDRAKTNTEETLDQEKQGTKERDDRAYQEFLNNQALISDPSLNIRDVKSGYNIIDGKKVLDAGVIMKDGKEYKTRVESDVPDTDNRAEISGGGVDWNKAAISSIDKDGSGVYINFEATTEGLKMTVKELATGGKVLNERVSIIQEVNK